VIHHILFPITYRCNLKCPFCKEWQKTSIVDIPAALAKIIEQAGQVEWIFITGGEPLLVEELIWVCDELRNAGFKVGVTTNGTIFMPEILDHVDMIGFSIDGDKEFHDNSRGEGVYDKAINFLKYAKEANKCETTVMSVALKDNQEALVKLKPILDEIDPTYWQVQTDVNNRDVPIPV
jgi:MoaA/NifB/PqqE/SkfB family radical SAM enzyme